MDVTEAPIDAARWRERCAQRFAELADDLTAVESKDLAREAYSLERTRAMRPEDAAEFVAAEMTRDGSPRFERRSSPR